MIQVYLAAPFFTPEQLLVVERLENLIRGFPVFSLYSPRADGVLMKMSPEERKKATKKIFDRNVYQMMEADLMIAVVDGRDTGTTWEMGYAFAREITIVTYTDKDYGLNVMIQESVEAHARGMTDMRAILEAINTHSYEKLRAFHNFHPGVT